MRKEGVLFLLIGPTLVLIGANYNQLLNAFNLFIFAGVIPVVNISLPDNVMFASSLAALAFLAIWPFRDAITKKLVRKNKSIKLLHPKQRSSKTT